MDNKQLAILDSEPETNEELKIEYKEENQNEELVTYNPNQYIWNRHFDPTSAAFYFVHTETGETTWDTPVLENGKSGSTLPLISYTESVQKIDEIVAVDEEGYEWTQNQIDKYYNQQRREELINAKFSKHRMINTLKDDLEKAKKEGDLEMLWVTSIREAKIGGNFTLQWKRLGYIDERILDFNKYYGFHLKSLILIGNDLRELPEDFGHNLPNLTYLSLANNHLTALPESFFRLRQLKDLNLLHNRIRDLTESFGYLNNLEQLYVSNNLLTHLPNSFGGLIFLRNITIECNLLETLPNTLSYLNCEMISVSSNCLTHLPKCIKNMKSLKTLYANKNRILRIPDDIGQSKSLEIIHLANNLITEIPEGMCFMKQLKGLWLDFNHLHKLPPDIYLLEKLESLGLNGNYDLKFPPYEIAVLSAHVAKQWTKKRHDDINLWTSRKIVVGLQECMRQLSKFHDLYTLENANRFKFKAMKRGVYQTVQRSQDEQKKRLLEQLDQVNGEKKRKKKKKRRKSIESIQSDSENEYYNSLLKEYNERKETINRLLPFGVDSPPRNDPLVHYAFFDGHFRYEDEDWFCFVPDWFWSIGLPALKKYWEINQGNMKGEIVNFPWKRGEVEAVLLDYKDAVGNIYKEIKPGQVGYFKRCRCLNHQGTKREVCIPPKIGYMCMRDAAYLKVTLTLRKDIVAAKMEQWRKEKIMKAERNAIRDTERFLGSEEGLKTIQRLARYKARRAIDKRILKDEGKRMQEEIVKKKGLLDKEYDAKINVLLLKKSKTLVDLQRQRDDLEKSILSMEGWRKYQTEKEIDDIINEMNRTTEDLNIRELKREKKKKLKKLKYEWKEEKRNVRGMILKQWNDMQKQAEKEREIAMKRTQQKHVVELMKLFGVNKVKENEEEYSPRRRKRGSIFDMIRGKRGSLTKFGLKHRMMKYRTQYLELVDELEAECARWFIEKEKNKARDELEKEFEVVRAIKKKWDGIGIIETFRSWQKYTRISKARRRKLAIKDYRDAIHAYEASKVQYELAHTLLGDWTKKYDKWTEKEYYFNEKTQESRWDEPVLEDFLPKGFVLLSYPENKPKDYIEERERKKKPMKRFQSKPDPAETKEDEDNHSVMSDMTNNTLPFSDLDEYEKEEMKEEVENDASVKESVLLALDKPEEVYEDQEEEKAESKAIEYDADDEKEEKEEEDLNEKALVIVDKESEEYDEDEDEEEEKERKETTEIDEYGIKMEEEKYISDKEDESDNDDEFNDYDDFDSYFNLESEEASSSEDLSDYFARHEDGFDHGESTATYSSSYFSDEFSSDDDSDEDDSDEDDSDEEDDDGDDGDDGDDKIVMGDNIARKRTFNKLLADEPSLESLSKKSDGILILTASREREIYYANLKSKQRLKQHKRVKHANT